MKLIVLSAAFFTTFVTACASSGTPIASEIQNLDYPEVGVTTSANIGDTIIVKGVLRTFPTITTQVPLRAVAYGADPHIIPAQTFVLTGLTSEFQIYRGAKHTLCEPVTGHGWKAAPLTAIEGACAFPVRSEVHVERGKVHDVKAPNFSQELIYNGKSGTAVKFLYRELSNDMMRPAFTQELQYDLNESNVIGFKEVRIEIVAATNTDLEYKVLQHFK
jgi:hypothetical protein